MKPPYKIQSLSEIKYSNGLKVISTFSGCGGSSSGYKLAGYDVIWANEFVDAAIKTYRENHESTILNTKDIREIKPQDILDETKLKVGELDIFDGSPPCSSFSTSGARQKNWGKEKVYSDNVIQTTDDLFFEYIRLVKHIQPKVFIAENVSGLVKGSSKGYFKIILEELKNCGYNVKAKLLNAAWLGVPQARQRLIFIGIRNDFNSVPTFPKPLPYFYTIKDACPWIDKIKNIESLYVETETDFSKTSLMPFWDSLQIGKSHKKRFDLTRTNPNLPCPTITASGGKRGLASVSHPYEPRKFSIAEVKRLCSFPDDYTLTGTYEQKYERLGRSVPPMMMYQIAKNLEDNFFRNLK